MQSLRLSGSKIQSGDVDVESPPSTKYEPLHLDTLDRQSTLTDQCNRCRRDIRRCIVQAQRAVVDVDSLSRSKFEPIEKRLSEHAFRLDIWGADCGATEGYLVNVRELSPLVGDIFGKLHAELEEAAEQTNIFRGVAPKISGENKSISPRSAVSRNHADILVDRHVSRLRRHCEIIAQSLLKLCELQPLIQSAQALERVGPLNELRNDIFQLKSQYPQDARSDITTSSISSVQESGDGGQDREQCDLCKQWVPFGALEFHQEFCSVRRLSEEAIMSSESVDVNEIEGGPMAIDSDIYTSTSSGTVDSLSHNRLLSTARSILNVPSWLHTSWLPHLHRHERIATGTLSMGMAVMTAEMMEIHIGQTPNIRGVPEYLPVAVESKSGFIGWRQKRRSWP